MLSFFSAGHACHLLSFELSVFSISNFTKKKLSGPRKDFGYTAIFNTNKGSTNCRLLQKIVKGDDL
jgi:hypothetical protein